MSQTFLAVLVALAAVFAFLAIASWRRCADALQEVTGIAASLRSMRGKVEAHDAEIEAITDAFHQLRGKFYAERRKYATATSAQASDAEASPPGSTKDELRRRIGLVPGRPAPHKE